MFFHHVLDKHSKKYVINCLDFDEHEKFHKDDTQDYWFSTPEFAKSFYDEVFPVLPTKGSNVKKLHMF